MKCNSHFRVPIRYSSPIGRWVETEGVVCVRIHGKHPWFPSVILVSRTRWINFWGVVSVCSEGGRGKPPGLLTDRRPLVHTCHESKFSYLYAQGHSSNMNVDENSRHSVFWYIELSDVITDNHAATQVAHKIGCRHLLNDPKHFPWQANLSLMNTDNIRGFDLHVSMSVGNSRKITDCISFGYTCNIFKYLLDIISFFVIWRY